jgi:hypothetical protein
MRRFRLGLRRYGLVSGFCMLTIGVGFWSGSSWAATGYNKIVNADIHQLCMDVKAEDDYNAPDARVQQWNCTGVQEQQWRLDNVGVPDVYRIRSERSNQCLDEVLQVSAFTGQPGGPDGVQIRQEPCNTTESQKWLFKTTGEIVNVLSGECLDTTSNSKGSMIMQWPCNGNIAQRWFSSAF